MSRNLDHFDDGGGEKHALERDHWEPIGKYVPRRIGREAREGVSKRQSYGYSGTGQQNVWEIYGPDAYVSYVLR